MVLDIHHYRCNHDEDEDLNKIIPKFINSWRKSGLKPKIHVSSPRSKKDMLSHNDYINPDDLYPFIKLMSKFNSELDVMVEAKKKDEAMFKLVKELNNYKGIKRIDDAKVNAF
jgi:UV DNA damage endonuclease